jgi:glycerate kinase
MASQRRPVLVAPDSFKGSVSATEVAAAIGRGLSRAGLSCDLAPIAAATSVALTLPLNESGATRTGRRCEAIVRHP